MKYKTSAILLLAILNLSIGGAAYASYNGIWRSPLWPDNKEPSREARVELSTASVPEESAFMQVVTSAAAPTPAKSAAVSSLKVHLPNGVSLELSQANFDELTMLVQMLGRLPCSGSTKG